MISKIKATLKKYNIPVKNAKITVGVSGGADSVALLLALIELQDEFSYDLQVVHINHNLRGDESLRDEKFVVDLCNKYGISCVVESVNVLELSKKHNQSIELCAREVRYKAFNKYSKGLIATAHNSDDNAETVILNLCRGTGIKGLCGIPPVRDNVIRPLIDCDRKQILQYLAEKNQPFVIDSSNYSDDYTRNKIRHHIIPLMTEINPSFIEAVTRTSILLRDEDEFFVDIASAQYNCYIKDGVVSSDLKLLHPSIRKRILMLYYKELCLEPDNFHLMEMDKVIMGEISAASLPSNLIFHKTGQGFIAENKIKEFQFCLTNFSLETDVLPKGGFEKIDLDYFKKLDNVNNLLLKFSIDCDKIKGNVTVRSRQDGDKYRPVFRNVTKTLKKLLCENKPTFADKGELFIIEDEMGIIFTNLFGIDERVKVTDSSKNILVYNNG